MENTTLRHQHLDCQGVKLHITQAGPETGPLIIMLHGFPEYWYSWRHQIECLAEQGFHVVVPDQRGYHLSDKPKRVRDYSVEKIAGDVIELMNVLGYEKAELIVGHDWGGVITWYLAQNESHRFTKAAVLNVPHPNAMRRTLLSSLKQLKKSWYIFFFQLPYLPESILSLQDCNIMASMVKRSSRSGSFTDDDMKNYVDAWKRPRALRSMINWYRAALRYPPSLSKSKIPIPLLLIWGMKDHALGSEMALPSLYYCENGRLKELPEATHWVQNDEPEKVNELLTEFLKSEAK